MKKLFFIGLLWLLFPLLAACTQSPPASLTPLPTDNETDAAIAFLDAARQRYSDNLTCGGSVYRPDLRISESDFLNLVLYDTNPRNGVSYCRYLGQPYEYRAFFQAYGYLRGTVTMLGETIAFDDSQPGVTRTGGGVSTVMKVYADGKVIGEDTYNDQVLNYFPHSVGVIRRQAADVTVLDIYYKPDCSGSQPHLTLVLVPVPNSPPPP